MKIETIAIHAGNKIDGNTGAAIQPITLSSTFERGEDGGYPGGFIYSRIDNPNRKSLENVVAKLEGAEDAAAFSSGNAAGSAVFQALGAGAHIIAPDDMYHGLRNQLLQVFEGIIEVSFVDLANINAIKNAIRQNTRLIWIETPSNPLLKISDLKAISELAKSKGILVACDNTFSTPVFQKPLELGCDLVMHSSTKYFGGHSDVVGGVLACRKNDDLWKKIKNVQVLSGAVPSPFDCYLTVRGIKTLPYRMRGHAQNAAKVAAFLDSHNQVEKVFYPGLKEHPGHDIAKSQMSDYGGMVSFLVKGGSAEARKFVNSVKIFTQATSLGGVESLIEHRASIEGPDTKTPQNLIRISVGLENTEDLIQDLNQALG
ncbi:MAG: cystathionine gamma-synthase [Sphingobacteriales bacterium 17-39-43]|uniref:trans-sulfuration enzyme family protein n=1 Tax=Daejeonella sp. TaxID=2805397 RepID=UPI000BD16510|nr:PLP-dependent aspartate aminotransferase family protein [Daejeonella sp.]OYZ32916.1 MAG: cystathionine gamma-synthase [Sphingobacteriales bacterium 16-39-50]OZA26326.1 MAG: cystathionine gamma-synthase [Sphingobacteriales bacterium 17-39-43]HQT23503.1 PLP-dependent aspartate aminotransferase family protein [Daejeonella sp.]HQT56182.1 PLP-dependent aspartate aminotransferase family protein [Daejeonella sp.]